MATCTTSFKGLVQVNYATAGFAQNQRVGVASVFPCYTMLAWSQRVVVFFAVPQFRAACAACGSACAGLCALLGTHAPIPALDSGRKVSSVAAPVATLLPLNNAAAIFPLHSLQRKHKATRSLPASTTTDHQASRMTTRAASRTDANRRCYS